jgi:crotonobetainyl-CoA:carnitine CoA-transferase CaiB-like acyl-CoA transferase
MGSEMNTEGAYAGLRVPDLGQVEQPEMGQFPTPRTPGVPLAVDAALASAPRIGEHGVAILAEIGIDPAAIASLCAENILLIPKTS